MSSAHQPEPDIIDPLAEDPLAFLYDSEDEDEDDTAEHPGYGSLLGVGVRQPAMGARTFKKALVLELDEAEALKAVEVMEINAGQLMTYSDRSQRQVGFLGLDPFDAMEEEEEEGDLAESLAFAVEEEAEDDPDWQPENPLAGTGLDEEEYDDPDWQPENPLAGTGLEDTQYPAGDYEDSFEQGSESVEDGTVAQDVPEPSPDMAEAAQLDAWSEASPPEEPVYAPEAEAVPDLPEAAEATAAETPAEAVFSAPSQAEEPPAAEQPPAPDSIEADVFAQQPDEPPPIEWQTLLDQLISKYADPPEGEANSETAPVEPAAPVEPEWLPLDEDRIAAEPPHIEDIVEATGTEDLSEELSQAGEIEWHSFSLDEAENEMPYEPPQPVEEQTPVFAEEEPGLAMSVAAPQEFFEPEPSEPEPIEEAPRHHLRAMISQPRRDETPTGPRISPVSEWVPQIERLVSGARKYWNRLVSRG